MEREARPPWPKETRPTGNGSTARSSYRRRVPAHRGGAAGHPGRVRRLGARAGAPLPRRRAQGGAAPSAQLDACCPRLSLSRLARAGALRVAPTASAGSQELVEHPRAELQRVDRHPLVDAVEQRRRSPGPAAAATARTRSSACRARRTTWRRCPPEIMYGAMCASGSSVRRAAAIASIERPLERRLHRGQVRHPLARDVRAEQLVDLAQERLLAARKEPAVDHRLRRRGNDVRLVAGLEHRGVGGVPHGRARRSGRAGRACAARPRRRPRAPPAR